MPATVDRYQLHELFYTDDDVVAYLGHDPLLNRSVTIELLRGERSGDPAIVARLLDKARQAALLDLPHVAALYDQGLIDDRPYLVLEAPLGPALRAVAPLPSERAVELADALAETLEVAQRNGQPLPALTADTVRLDSDGHVQILNLGLRPPPDVPAALATLGDLLGMALGDAALPGAPALQTLLHRLRSGALTSVAGLRAALRDLRQRTAMPTTAVSGASPTVPIEAAPTVVVAPSASRRRARPSGRQLLGGLLLAGLLALGIALWQLQPEPPAADALPDQPTPTGMAVASPAPAAGPRLIVATATGQALVVRTGPGTNYPRITSLRNGTVVEVLEGPQPGGRYTWVRIRAGDVEGWCVREALREP